MSWRWQDCESAIQRIPQLSCGGGWRTYGSGLNLQRELTAKCRSMNEEPAELLQAIARVVSVFDALGVDYLVGGSVASSLFGEPRQTLDADLVARLLGKHAEPLAAHLEKEFYADVKAIQAAIQNQGCFNLIHLQTMTKVDVFVRWRDPFAQSQFARRQKKSVGQAAPLEFLFASAEDTVLSKLEWYQKGGEVSERQWRDVQGVLKVQAGVLDRDYLARWASELGLSLLLLRALNEAGLSNE